MTFATNVFTNAVAVASGNSNIMYAANRGTSVNAPLWKSTDGGSNWTTISPADATWSTIACSSDGNVVLAGNSGSSDTTYARKWAISTDGGSNWTAGTTSNVDPGLSAMSADGVYMYTMLDGGTTLYRSSDTGATWSTTTVPITRSIACSADGTFVAIGRQTSPPQVSKNSGATFTAVVGTPNQTFQVGMSDSGDIIAAVSTSSTSGRIWIGTDKGTSWYEQSAVLGRTWASPAVSGDGSKIVAGPSNGKAYVGTAP
jgi:hypothetical protein